MRLPILMMLCLAGAARAGEKPLAVVVPAEINGVIYKVEELRQILTAHLGERLRSRGYLMLGPNTLIGADASCHEQACLEGIPARYNVDLVIAPTLSSDEKSHTYRIGVRLFSNGGGFKTRERLCVNCSDFNARDMLGDTVVEMLGGVVVDVPAPSPAPAIEHPVTPRPARSPWLLRGLAIGVGVVGVLSLAQGFAEVAHDGDRACDARCYHLDTSKGQAVFLTIGVAALVTTGVLAYFGWRPARADKLSASGLGVRF